MDTINTIAGTIIFDGPPVWAGSLLDWPGTLGQPITNLITHLVGLWHTAGALWWPWAAPDPAGWWWHRVMSGWHWVTSNAVLLGLLVLLAVTVVAAARVTRRWLWRRAVARGCWMAVIPPRQTHPGQSAAVWRLLASLAARTQAGWHLVKPPLSVEVHADAGRLTLAVWVPGWIPASTLAAQVRLAWPGATTKPFTPLPGGDGWQSAGYRMKVSGTDLGPLVNDLHLGIARGGRSGDADPLRPVFDTLRRGGGPTVLQLLVRPATGRHISALSNAARRPAPPKQPLAGKALGGLLSLLSAAIGEAVDLLPFVGGTSTRSHRTSGGKAQGYRPPDALQRLAMRQAADKLSDGCLLLVAVRTLAVRPGRGHARADARSLANCYTVAAWRLRPQRLWRAASAVADRHARPGQWLLATATELGVLLHLPGDPARYGFTVAALTRPHPQGAARLGAEQDTERDTEREGERGWSRGRGDIPPGVTTTALAMRDEDHRRGRRGQHDRISVV